MDHSLMHSDLVVVIGASSLDIVSRLDGDLRMGTSNPSSIRTSFGGAARNVAENLARLGQKVALLSVIGKDRIGDEAIQYTAQANVDMTNVFRTEKFPTGFYMGVLNQNGKREFAFDDMRILEELTPAYLEYNEDLIAQAGMIFVDSNMPADSLKKIFELAREYKVPICADPTSGSLAHNLIPYLKQIHLIVPNGLEAEVLIGSSFDHDRIEGALNAARLLVARGVDEVFISIGDQGLCYASSETNGHFPAISTLVSDPTGAGDALTAAVIFAHMNNIDLDDAAKLGVSAATITLRHIGTVDPTLSIERLYDELAN